MAKLVLGVTDKQDYVLTHSDGTEVVISIHSPTKPDKNQKRRGRKIVFDAPKSVSISRRNK